MIVAACHIFSIHFLRSRCKQVLAELNLDRDINFRGEIGAREKVLLCALNSLEESVGSVYGLDSAQVFQSDLSISTLLSLSILYIVSRGVSKLSNLLFLIQTRAGACWRCLYRVWNPTILHWICVPPKRRWCTQLMIICIL